MANRPWRAGVKPIRIGFLASPEFQADPYPFYARMRRDAPVFPITAPAPFFPRGWLVTRYDDVAAMLKDERMSRDILAQWPRFPRFLRPLVDNMLGREPPDHTRLRRLVAKGFTPVRVEQLRGRIEQICDELLAKAPSDRPFDLVAGYALPAPLTVIAELLGIPASDRSRFQVLASKSLRLAIPAGGLLDVPIGLPYFWLLMRYLRGLFAERRLRPRDDLLSALVQAEEEGDRLSTDELLGTALLLLVAGYETTVHLIAGGTLALLQHPGERARFVHEPGLAANAVEEMLRFTSPLPMTTPRIALEDVTYGSATIPKGEWAMGVLASANRDDSQFVEPERLDLGREPNKHLAFGMGHHFCLGASLARLEGQIALTTLFRRSSSMRLAQPVESLRWRKSLLRALVSLPVTF